MNERTSVRSPTRVSTLITGIPAAFALATDGCSAVGSVGINTSASGFCARTASTTGICVAGEYSDGSPCQIRSTPFAFAAATAPTFIAWKNGSDSAPITNAIFLFAACAAGATTVPVTRAPTTPTERTVVISLRSEDI